MDSSTSIIVYIILWAVTFIVYLRKKKIFDAGSVIIASYLTYAVLSYFLYVNYYKDDDIRELELFPFIYLYLMMLIFLQPIMRFDSKCKIQQPRYSLINKISSVIIGSALVVAPVYWQDMVDAIVIILTTDTGGEELYYLAALERGKSTSFALFNIFKIIFNCFSDFTILLFFYYLILPNKKKIILWGLLFTVFVSMLESIIGGGRTGITMKILISVTSFFMFRHHLSTKIRKVVSSFGIGIVLFFSSIMVIIGESRFSDNSNYQLLNYSGQAPLYFNKYGLDAGGIRYGDRTCSIFKKMLLFDDVPTNFDDCRQKYNKMKMNDSRFSTFVGDFTLDFGPVWATVIFCLFSFTMIRLTKNRNGTIMFHQLILVFLVMSICITGGMYLFYYSFKGNYVLIGFIIMYFLFKWDHDKFYYKAINYKEKKESA